MFLKLLFAGAGTSALAGLCACGSAAVARPRPPEPAEQVAPALSPAAEPEGELHLDEALRLALEHSPTLLASALDQQVAAARVEQAGLRPNPELRFELENVLGGAELSGFERAESTLALSQRFEVGGQRGARLALAEAESRLRTWDVLEARYWLSARVRMDFQAVWAAQERLALAREQAAHLRRAAEIVHARIEAGAVSPVEATRAQVETGFANGEERVAAVALTTARNALAAHWGAAEARFTHVVGPSAPPAEVASLESIAARLEGHPALARWNDERTQRQAAVALAERAAIPDVELYLGLRRLEEFDQQGLVAGAQVPLPLFHRNQGSVREARLRLARAAALQAADRARLRTELAAAYGLLQAAYAQWRGVRDEVVPAAESALQAVSEGYQLGHVGVVDLLDAQRRAFESRRRELEARESYFAAAARIEGLVPAAAAASP